MFDLFIIGTTIVLALLTVELKNLFHSVICLLTMCTLVGFLFGILKAIYVMAFQLIIYSGIATVLFIYIMKLTEVDEE